MSETTALRPVSFASLVQQFFTEYLVTQRALSPRTIASYRANCAALGKLLAMMCENWVHRIHKFSDSVSEKLGGYLLRVT